MKLSVQGELPVFNALIEAVRKELDGIDPTATVNVELADDANHGNSLIFTRTDLKYFVRVRFVYWDKDRFAFVMVLRLNKAELEEDRCIFSATQLDRGTRAAAAFIRQRLLSFTDKTFDHFFQREKQ